MDRKQEILRAIVKHFVQTAEPVGSNTILVSYKFQVSPATIRNDMAILEKEGLIYQPHTSSGRVPTDQGYRMYVDEIADYKKAKKHALSVIKKIRQQYKADQIREHIYDAVALLAHATENVSFATLPDNERTFYIGLANVLKQPEFQTNSIQASQVVEILENNDNFRTLLDNLDINDSVKIFIGKENIIEQIQSCALIVTKYERDGFTGYLGILGPTRMAYPFNKAIIEEVKSLFEERTSL
ncbi:DeoR family transcriptional regulator [Patescibacteria group bacterium]|nr:DeoR family transcriptional regulator [Patescibacteria group bacterium]